MSRKRNNKPVQPKTLLDIVILSHNQSELLTRCLQNIPLAVGDIPHAVYVLDNGSSAEESTKIREITKDKATYVFSKDNLGFPAGNNKLVRRCSSPLILLLNNDVFMYPESIRNMVMAMDDPTLGVVGAKLIFDTASTDRSRPAGKVQHVGISVNIKGRFFHHLMGWSPDNPRVLRVHYPYVVTGAALMTRRKIYTQLGGLNEIYGRGTYEDVEYCLQCRQLGYNIYLEQNAMGIHLVGATALSEQIPYPMEANYDMLRMRLGNKFEYTEWEIW